MLIATMGLRRVLGSEADSRTPLKENYPDCIKTMIEKQRSNEDGFSRIKGNTLKFLEPCITKQAGKRSKVSSSESEGEEEEEEKRRDEEGHGGEEQVPAEKGLEEKRAEALREPSFTRRP